MECFGATSQSEVPPRWCAALEQCDGKVLGHAEIVGVQRIVDALLSTAATSCCVQPTFKQTRTASSHQPPGLLGTYTAVRRRTVEIGDADGHVDLFAYLVLPVSVRSSDERAGRSASESASSQPLELLYHAVVSKVPIPMHGVSTVGASQLDLPPDHQCLDGCDVNINPVLGLRAALVTYLGPKSQTDVDAKTCIPTLWGFLNAEDRAALGVLSKSAIRVLRTRRPTDR